MSALINEDQLTSNAQMRDKVLRSMIPECRKAGFFEGLTDDEVMRDHDVISHYNASAWILLFKRELLGP